MDRKIRPGPSDGSFETAGNLRIPEVKQIGPQQFGKPCGPSARSEGPLLLRRPPSFPDRFL